MSLKSVLLPQSLLSIPDSAFEGCISLDNVTLPPNIKYIGDDAFCNCQSLTELCIPPIHFKYWFFCISRMWFEKHKYSKDSFWHF